MKGRRDDWARVGNDHPARHVWFVKDPGGRQGVMKTPRRKDAYNTRRFADEARGMAQLFGQPGVLQLLDVDRGTEPMWMVTEQAELLRDHLGSDPDLRETVSAVAEIANTLARLLERASGKIAHRDLKPPNLFWLNGHALVGDFGIATWPFRGNDITRVGGAIGPANYLAPEAREHDPNRDPFPGDVYSLANSMWALVMDCAYPPGGTLYARREEVSLFRRGGKSSDELATLLEAATAYRPIDRPSMAQFRDELTIWLQRYPPGSTHRVPSLMPGYRVYSMAERSEINLHGSDSLRILTRCLQELTRELRKAFPEDQVDSTAEFVVDRFADVSWLGGGDPDWVPDLSEHRQISWVGKPLRVIVDALLEGEDAVTYLIEIQTQAPDQSWGLEWHDYARGILRFPSDFQARDSLAAAVRTEIARLRPPESTQAASHDDDN